MSADIAILSHTPGGIVHRVRVAVAKWEKDKEEYNVYVREQWPDQVFYNEKVSPLMRLAFREKGYRV